MNDTIYPEILIYRQCKLVCHTITVNSFGKIFVLNTKFLVNSIYWPHAVHIIGLSRSCGVFWSLYYDLDIKAHAVCSHSHTGVSVICMQYSGFPHKSYNQIPSLFHEKYTFSMNILDHILRKIGKA